MKQKFPHPTVTDYSVPGSALVFSPTIRLGWSALSLALILIVFAVSGWQLMANEPVLDEDTFLYEQASVPAPSIGESLIGEAHEQSVHVFLPPSYGSGEQRYPVLYFYVGYSMSEDIHYLRSVLPQTMTNREFIIVSVDCVNRLQGTFGMNSPVIGNWRDFYVKDLIPWVDAHYRTKADRRSRAVAGMSMGGHIALRLAMDHPELFNTLYALVPGVMDENGLEDAWPLWDQTFRIAYGSAVAPNTSKPFPHADIPTMDGSPEDTAARLRWQSGFGNLPDMIENYLGKPDRIEHICIEAGIHDSYPWITKGCAYLSRLLTEHGVAHQYVLTNNGHDFGPKVFVDGMGPYVATHLE